MSLIGMYEAKAAIRHTENCCILVLHSGELAIQHIFLLSVEMCMQLYASQASIFLNMEFV